MNNKLIRSRAPLRISFCGGGTDVKPYPEEKGGCVLSTTIDMYAYATVKPRKDQEVHVTSLDYDIVAKYHTQALEYDGKLDLIKAALKLMNIQQGLELFIHSDAPPGSGLGSSSTMVVAVIGALAKWQKVPMTSYEIAELAYRIEREELGIQGGMQDQYAAAFGGFNFIEFNRNAVIVNPLRIHNEHLSELAYHLILCYTGKTRLSGHIVEEQRESYINRKSSVVNALDEMKALTIDMKNALLKGQLSEFAQMLHVAWESKKRLNQKISNESIDQLYAIARKNGALGGKILGAGGGGYLLVYAPFERKHIIAAELEAVGGQVVGFNFDYDGLQSWLVDA